MQFAVQLDGGNPHLDRAHQHTSAPAESLSGKCGIGQLTLSDIDKLAGHAAGRGLAPLEIFDPGKPITFKDLNLGAALSGLNHANRSEEAAQRAADRILKNHLNPDIDPGFSVRSEDKRPMHTMVQDRIRSSTFDISRREEAVFEKLWNGLSKSQQDQMRAEIKREDIRPDALIDGLNGLNGLRLPNLVGPLGRFKNELIQALTPLEKQRQEREDAVYKSLTPSQRSALNAEIEVRPV